jgi:hypothetical protein
MVSSAVCGIARQLQIVGEFAVAAQISQHGQRAAAITIRPAARPSRPSVTFTALLEPTTTNTKKM